MIEYIKNWLFGISRKEAEQIDANMKYLVVGLGNMHPDYNGTRHNIGFEAVDLMAQNANVNFKNESLGDIALIKHKGRYIHLLKPSTYMNLSGKSVSYWMAKHKILQENVLILVDDKNLDFGIIRMRAKGAAGGHNGLKDIEKILGNANYARLRMGIGSDFSQGRQVDFVLGKWSKDELKGLGDFLSNAAEAALSFCSIGLSHTMNKFNN